MKRNMIAMFVLAAAVCVARAQDQNPPSQGGGNAPAAGMQKPGHKHGRMGGKAMGACKSDAEALCKDVKKGQGRIVNCLVSGVEKIKDDKCKERIQKLTARRDELKSACQSDIDADCKGMDFGTGLAKCLHENRKKLSDTCKGAFKKGGHKKDTGTGEEEE